MPNIFGRSELTWGGGIRADRGVLQDAGGLTGILMQNIQVQYQRPVTKIYELGRTAEPTKVYYVEGRPQGSLTIARVIGFAATIGAFYTNYGDACKAKDNNLALNLTPNYCPGDKPAKPTVLNMKHCILTSVGFSVQAQQLVVNENSAMEFADMSYEGQ